MAWTEEKRKKIWGRKANPATIMGFLIMLYGVMTRGYVGLGMIILGLVILIQGFRMHKKYSQ